MSDRSVKDTMREAEIAREIEECRIRAYTYVYPCEDEEKVVKALKNVLNGEVSVEVVDPEKGIKRVSVSARGAQHVYRIFNQFRSRQVLAAVRKHLLKYCKENKILMYLHKQSAYAGVYSICDVGESPLGEIVVEIEVGSPRDVIYMLTRF